MYTSGGHQCIIQDAIGEDFRRFHDRESSAREPTCAIQASLFGTFGSGEHDLLLSTARVSLTLVANSLDVLSFAWVHGRRDGPIDHTKRRGGTASKHRLEMCNSTN